MSGHSKWATIKRQKSVNDAKRGNVFTKLGNAITLAAKHGGGDPEINFKLRLAVERAKAANLPKGNIDRAIKRGTGEITGNTIEELSYGALLPGQVAVIINCATDNKNRTLSDVKSTITKNGGQFVDLSSIIWQFEQKGVIKINKQAAAGSKQEDLEMKIIDSGAENYSHDDKDFLIYTKQEQLKLVKDNLEKDGFKIDSAGLEMVAKEKIEISEEELNKTIKILEALEEIDEVNECYTNLN